MKRKGLAILCVLMLLAVLLTACGGSGGDIGNSSGASTEASYSTGSDNGGNSWGWDAAPEAPAEAEADYSGQGGSGEAPSSARLQNAKIIYTANLEMETTSFEDCAAGLETLVEQLGGYMEYASVNHYGSGYQGGSYSIRIPSAQFEHFLRSVGEIGHITYQDKSGENISEAYYDTESRLTTQRTKLERLQALLAQAENMEDIITIESAIAETEYAIEQLTGTLRHYDALVDFATIYIGLSEVTRLSSVEQTPPAFTSRLGTAFAEGWQGFASGMEGLAIALAYGWMWIVLIAVIILLAVRLYRKPLRWLKKQRNPKAPDHSGKDQK
ncbi:MAG: DUF4349 domain-containing protein [Oscillibacter sp.]|nr:DUF4349 domain-containing protein [Oscillibacter sp.]